MCVVPQPHAGGSFAMQVYGHAKCPVAVEQIQADAGIDIGCTLIGMHLKRVAVPVRLKTKYIGICIIIIQNGLQVKIVQCISKYAIIAITTEKTGI